MIKIEKGHVSSSDGKMIRRKGGEVCFRMGTVLPGETEASFEEVDEEPQYTKAEYDAKVAEMVRRRYTASEEFALQRKMIDAIVNPAPVALSDDGEERTDGGNAAVEEFAAYDAYVNECKEGAASEIAADKARAAEQARIMAEKARKAEEAKDNIAEA